MIAAIETQASATGQTKTEIVEAILRAALGMEVGDDAPDVMQRLTDVERRLTDVERRLTENAQRCPAPPSSRPAQPTGDEPGFPVADGVDLMTTTQAWQYCLGLGWASPEGKTTKAAFRSWARRNLIPLMEQYGIEPTGYQGKSNAVASYRRVMMPDGV